MEEMVKQIEYIEATDALDQQAKMKFFSDARQGFGCSALVLQGGTAFGKDRWWWFGNELRGNINHKVIALYHLGVLKALHEQGLLPRIISGHAVGAMVAALICIHTDEELPVSRRLCVCAF